MKLKRRLPSTPSKLLRLAVKDLKAIRRRKGYDIKMSIWHDGTDADGNAGTTCSVCMAGAVMANTLKVPRTLNFEPDNCSPNSSKLYAINYFRTGEIEDALSALGDKYLKKWQKSDKYPNIYIRPYNENHLVFFEDMNKLIKDLESLKM